MSIHVDIDALIEACEWVSAGESIHAEAYVGKSDGRIFWKGDGVDEDPPEDADDATAYVAVPHRNEFDLGRRLALRFVEEHLPRSLDTVEGYFRRRGAYSNFKSLLDGADQLEKWHAYENAAIEDSLTQWCVENGFVASKKGSSPI